MAILDKETKKLIFTLFSAMFVIVIFLWVASNGASFLKTSTKIVTNIAGNKTYDEPYKYNLDKNKSYYLTVSTNKGDMKFLLNKDVAPNTVNNITNLVKNDFYKNSSYFQKNDTYLLLGKGGSQESVNYRIPEEINADSLNLNTLVVKDYFEVLKQYYDSDLLIANQDHSVKNFFTSQGYSFITSVKSKKITKGSLVMYSDTANNFGNLFYISFGSNPISDGRMTNFGDLIAGEDVLNLVISADPTDIVINSILLLEQ